MSLQLGQVDSLPREIRQAGFEFFSVCLQPATICLERGGFL